MPLFLSDRGVDTLIAHYERNHNYEPLLRSLLRMWAFWRRFLKILFGLQLLQQVFPFLHFGTKGIARRGISTCVPVVAFKTRKDARAAADTIITIEASESTPLLADPWWRQRCHYTYGGSSSSGSITNNNNNNSITSKYSFSSHADGCTSSSFISKAERFCEFRLIVFIVALAAGLAIATYLLVIETRLPSLRFSLDLVNHDIWSKMSIPLGGLLNHSNVVNVMLTHTGGMRCTAAESCLRVLQELQMQSASGNELPYNFLIGSDGLTYEVRGWDHESGCLFLPQSTSLVIGFIGNYTAAPPSDVQLQSTRSLLRESIRRRKLQRQYHIYGVRNLTASAQDAEALLKHVSKWPRFVAQLQLL